MSVDFIDRDIIRRQLESAEIHIDVGYEYIIVHFTVRDAVSWRHGAVIPVNMIAWGSDDVPHDFILHLKNGFVSELEVVRMDLEQISADVPLERLTLEHSDVLDFDGSVDKLPPQKSFGPPPKKR